jgi:ribonuclease P protein component
MKESLSPRERIKKKKDFLILYRKGNRYKGKYFNLIYLSNVLPYSRVGVVASRKVGGAVTRNRVKRWMRELFRRNKELLGYPIDLIIVATPEMGNVTWVELRDQYSRALGRVFEERRGR